MKSSSFDLIRLIYDIKQEVSHANMLGLSLFSEIHMDCDVIADCTCQISIRLSCDSSSSFQSKKCLTLESAFDEANEFLNMASSK